MYDIIRKVYSFQNILVKSVLLNKLSFVLTQGQMYTTLGENRTHKQWSKIRFHLQKYSTGDIFFLIFIV